VKVVQVPVRTGRTTEGVALVAAALAVAGSARINGSNNGDKPIYQDIMVMAEQIYDKMKDER